MDKFTEGYNEGYYFSESNVNGTTFSKIMNAIEGTSSPYAYGFILGYFSEYDLEGIEDHFLRNMVKFLRTPIEISTTYEVVTYESAKDGGFHDTGFVNEGEDFTIKEAINFLTDKGSLECSCYPLDFNNLKDVWLSESDSEYDYSTGNETRHAFHFGKNTNPEILKIVFKSLQENRTISM